MLGLPPVDHLYKGQPGVESACPITNTIYDDDLERNSVFVETDGYKVTVEDSRTLPTKALTFFNPPTVTEFIHEFDWRRIEELIEE
jgi:hypothetical protein